MNCPPPPPPKKVEGARVQLRPAVAVEVRGALVALAVEVVDLDEGEARHAQPAAQVQDAVEAGAEHDDWSRVGFSRVWKTLVSTPASLSSRRGVT